MNNNETIQILSEVDTLKALLGEQSNIMNMLVRDNMELIAAVDMFISFAESTEVDSDEIISKNATKLIGIGRNLLSRIAKDCEENND